MNRYFFFLLLVVGSIWGFHESLVNGNFLRFLDEHPHPIYSPPVLYYTGVTYGLFQDLETAGTYYIRVPEKFPTSPYADDAYYEYLQTVDERMVLPRSQIAEEFDKYIEKFPHGKHEAVIRNRISVLRIGT